MRSLAAKLTLAFLFVGIIGAVLVAVLVGQRTRSEFDRFVVTREESIALTTLGNYYLTNGGWEQVDRILKDKRRFTWNEKPLTLFNEEGRVVFSTKRYRPGQRVPPPVIQQSRPIVVDEAVVGYLLFENGTAPPQSQPMGRNPVPAENAEANVFLARVAWATVISAAVAGLIALLLGGLLARNFARPIRELTQATQAMASGQLSQRVPVRSQDEIGKLSAAFNQMSTDLAEASRLRQQMTADIAHDLRTPLSILRGYTEGLKDGQLKATPQMYQVMHEEVAHLQHLVDDLRTLSLADAGELRLHRRPVAPKALLERTALAYALPAEQQGLSLRLEAASNLPPISVDVERMTQVLNNLVSNALRHTEQGHITLSATQTAAGQIALSVQDTGSGIPAEDLPHIFNRFYRADKARQRDTASLDTEGTSSGLGLAIAQAIVQAHTGQLDVESIPGEGTRFTISLPAHQTG